MQLEIEREALKKEKDQSSRDRLEAIERDLADLKEERDALRSRWDQERQAIQSISITGFRALMVAVSTLGNGWVPFVLVILTGAGLFAARFRLEGIVLIVEVALGWCVNTLFKWLIGRPRPARALRPRARRSGSSR